MKNLIQEGDLLTVVAPAAVKSGDLVAVGQIIGVAMGDAALGADVVIHRKGVFTLPKANEAMATVGLPLYYDPVNACLTKTEAAGTTLVGSNTEAAAQADTTVSALLDGTIRLAKAGA